MNWIDALIVIIWIITAVWGFSTGAIRLAIPLMVVIAGLAVSSRFGETVGNIFSVITDSEGTQAIAGFALIFLGALLLSALLSFWLSQVLRFLPIFGLANRLAGLALGVVIGFVVLSGLLTGAQKYTDRVDDDIHGSTLGTLLADNFDVVLRGVKLVPGDWDDELRDLVYAALPNWSNIGYSAFGATQDGVLRTSGLPGS